MLTADALTCNTVERGGIVLGSRMKLSQRQDVKAPLVWRVVLQVPHLPAHIDVACEELAVIDTRAV